MIRVRDEINYQLAYEFYYELYKNGLVTRDELRKMEEELCEEYDPKTSLYIAELLDFKRL